MEEAMEEAWPRKRPGKLMLGPSSRGGVWSCLVNSDLVILPWYYLVCGLLVAVTVAALVSKKEARKGWRGERKGKWREGG